VERERLLGLVVHKSHCCESVSAGEIIQKCHKSISVQSMKQGLNWGGGIPPDLRSGTSCLRSTTSNNLRDPVHHNWDPAPFCWDPPFCTVYIWVFFLYAWCFIENVVLHGHFVICICTCLVWIDVASVKLYLNAIKAKQSALNARKSLVGGREPHLCSRPFGLEFRPFKPRAYRDPPPLAE